MHVRVRPFKGAWFCLSLKDGRLIFPLSYIYFRVGVGLQRASKVRLIVCLKGMFEATLMDLVGLALIWFTLKSLLNKGLNILRVSPICPFWVRVGWVWFLLRHTIYMWIVKVGCLYFYDRSQRDILEDTPIRSYQKIGHLYPSRYFLLMTRDQFFTRVSYQTI